MKSNAFQIISAVLLAVSTFYLNQTAANIREVRRDVSELRSDFHDHEKDFRVHITK